MQKMQDQITGSESVVSVLADTRSLKREVTHMDAHGDRRHL